LQPEATKVTAPQQRIAFVPTVEEIMEFTVPHLEKAPRAVISFGQGCEGEPLLESELIIESIKTIRRRTKKGIINLNTNAGRPDAVRALLAAGLDSIRVSLNSAQEHYYDAYYRPNDFCLADVEESLLATREAGKWSSLNYLIFPGFSDHRQEVEALARLIQKTKINMIQTRNLNIDPEWYIKELKLGDLEKDFMGIPNWIEHVREKFPWLKLGYFNPPLEEMKREHFRFGDYKRKSTLL
jgi:pyruvate-formate lyase-activating enzyme